MPTSSNRSPPHEDIPLPTLSEPALKQHDFATRSEPTLKGNGLTAEKATHKGHDDADDTASDTATNSSDEFDWDDDEADAEGETQRKRGQAVKARRGRAVWMAFMKLARPVRTTLVGILGCGILITPLLVFEFCFRSSPAYPHVFAWSLWFSIIFAASCITSLVVDLFPRIFIRLATIFGARVESLKRQVELVMAVSAWSKLALSISWAWIALSVIRGVRHPPGGYWVVINRVMQALFSAGLIFWVEKICLHLIAITFHEKALAERLAENRLGLKALDRLSNVTPIRAPGTTNIGGKGHRANRSSGNLFNFGKQAQASSSGGSSPMGEKDGLSEKKSGMGAREGRAKRKKAIAAVIVDQLGSAVGQVALKNSRFNRGQDYGSLESARKLAKKLFMRLNDVMPPRAHLIVDDFRPYFSSDAEAQAAFALFDKDGNGDLSKREMRESVQRIYRERKALTASLKDVSAAVAKLDAVLLFVALVIELFICLLIFNRENTLQSLVPVATLVLGFSFIFGHSAQLLFESLVFIFSTHVFDVGDLVMIDDQILFVQEFGLFSTVFKRVDGMQVIAPNALLSGSKIVHNLRRSSSMWETTTLMVSYETPLEIIETLRQRLKQYVANNSREWSACEINIDKMEYQNAIHLIVAMEHRPNWQDWGGRWARRTPFMRHMKEVLEELDVRYTMPVQPVLMPRGGPPQGSPRPGGAGQGWLNADAFGGLSGGLPRGTAGGNPGFYQPDPRLTESPIRSIRPGGDRF